ncbi:phosphoglycerate mutase GpmB [Streptomyces griseus subsp. griseus]
MRPSRPRAARRRRRTTPCSRCRSPGRRAPGSPPRRSGPESRGPAGVRPPTWARPPRSSCCGTARPRSRPRRGSPAAAAPTPSFSATGRGQAERAAGHFAALGAVQEIVSSPLRRCRETAAAVADRLGLDVRIDEGLRETDFGAWEGLTFGEVRERYADDLTAWLASPDTAPTGGGESFAEVAERVAAARDRIVARYAGRTVLLVTHVTPIKTLVRLALGAPPEALFRMELSAASISAVAYYGDGNASVRVLNDTSHLR